VLAAGVVLLFCFSADTLLVVLWRLLPPAVSANFLLIRNISTGGYVRRVFFYKKNSKAAKEKLCHETENIGVVDDTFLVCDAKTSPYNIGFLKNTHKSTVRIFAYDFILYRNGEKYENIQVREYSNSKTRPYNTALSTKFFPSRGRAIILTDAVLPI
jgi:hypothetical protein